MQSGVLCTPSGKQPESVQTAVSLLILSDSSAGDVLLTAVTQPELHMNALWNLGDARAVTDRCRIRTGQSARTVCSILKTGNGQGTSCEKLMESASGAEDARRNREGHAVSAAWADKEISTTEDTAMPDYWHNPRHPGPIYVREEDNEDEIYIDVHVPAGERSDVDSGTRGTRSVETGAEFDALPRDCSGAGIEDETINI